MFVFSKIQPPKNASANERTAVWPGPRYGHASTIAGHALFIYGGKNGSKEYNDLFRYDFEANLWTEIIVDGFVYLKMKNNQEKIKQKRERKMNIEKNRTEKRLEEGIIL